MNHNSYILRLKISYRYLEQTAGNLTYHVDVLFTDEATYTRSLMFMIHNSHLWVYNNPTVVVILLLFQISSL